MSSPHGATWRSGYATVCKTVYSGSIPDVASTFKINDLDRIREAGSRATNSTTNTAGFRMAKSSGPLISVERLIIVG